MSVDYSAVAMYGMYFRTRSELANFVENIYPDAEVDGEKICGVPVLEDVCVKCLDAYSGDQYILGWHVELGESLEPYKEKWKSSFPNNIEDASPHLEVEVH